MESIDKKYTFWQLLGEFKVEIPIIQRDYAQGRENVKTKQIRDNFLDKILAAIDDENSILEKKSLDLDFVYGSAADNKFIPLDGQQRLTTLFLLHWYVASLTDNLQANKQILLNFSYETRISSREFCHALINSNLNIGNETLSSQLKDCSWFFLSWSKDPTIKAMLVMLDAIHSKLQHVVKAKHWQALTEERIITFQFLDMNHENLQLTDELYVKMNARGKALTDFENFKAWVEQFIDEKNYIIKVEDWKTKFDKDWTDLFWNYKDGDNHLIDEEFMRFFNGMVLNQYAAGFKGNIDKDEIYKKNVQALSAKKENGQEVYIPISIYLDIQAFSEASVNDIFQTLEFIKGNKNQDINTSLSGIKFYTPEESIFESFIQGDITYPDRLRFYALSQVLIKNEISIESNPLTLQRWMRFIRNLIENTTIDSAETFSRAINSITSILANKNVFNNLYEYLSDVNTVITGFDGNQIKEEKLKALLIHNSQNTEWEAYIIEAENHPMFRGNIGFLLPENRESEFTKFISRKNVAFRLFNKDGVNEKFGRSSNLLGRLLLAMGLGLQNDELWLGGKQQYWKGHLKNAHYIPFIVKAIDLLLDADDESYSDILNANLNVAGLESWKEHLVNNPRLFKEYTYYGRIKKDWRGINLYQQEKFNANVNAILIENNRNEVITELLKEGQYKLVNPHIIKCENFYAGDKIELRNKKIILSFGQNKVKIYQLNEESKDGILIAETSFLEGSEVLLESINEHLTHSINFSEA
ncbi:DUF262 domain-containing protein [Rufibacter sp. LB8]|uniref:DUF262 domain-containing protein n=1 Tax=Rufibacter sp. LB8 TaxID=2777781 RepID=UPI00178C2AF1|nr:DUF262 domain-containing protein [Rufibacter sp. LB8]